MKNYSVDYRQERLSLEDTVRHQTEFIQMLENKMKNPILTKSEKDKLLELSAYSLLSYGKDDRVYFGVGEQGNLEFPSLRTLILRMRDYASSKEVVFLRKSTYGRDLITERIRVSTADLWKFIYNWCLTLFPKASSEGYKRSKEVIKRKGTSAYEFSVDEKLHE